MAVEAAEGKLVGRISHFFSHLMVGVIELEDTLKVGDTIRIKGAHDDFTQTVESMQVEHQAVQEAGPGDAVGVKVIAKVHEGDKVYVV